MRSFSCLCDVYVSAVVSFRACVRFAHCIPRKHATSKITIITTAPLSPARPAGRKSNTEQWPRATSRLMTWPLTTIAGIIDTT